MVGKGVPLSKRKYNKIYTNYDEMGNPLTYSIKLRERNGRNLIIERNSRTPLQIFQTDSKSQKAKLKKKIEKAQLESLRRISNLRKKK